MPSTEAPDPRAGHAAGAGEENQLVGTGPVTVSGRVYSMLYGRQSGWELWIVAAPATEMGADPVFVCVVAHDELEAFDSFKRQFPEQAARVKNIRKVPLQSMGYAIISTQQRE